MGGVPVINLCAGGKGLVGLNHKVVRDKVVDQELGLSDEDKSRITEVAGDVNHEHDGLVQFQAGLQRPGQQLQGPLIHWQRFLPMRSLKVLLVENDDSTRHVVSALLRNCGYEVIATSNGLQAWKILEDLTNHIGLVLTEVVMPFLSGIDLLCKVMNHKTCKNIPVIMMSSHDSMSVVFKCLSKGAVDFLVKPIRKNELRNLWQHAWRRCHSSSDSGSESGHLTQKYAKAKSTEESDNNTGNNDENDSVCSGLNDRDGSYKENGTQSSWTKREVEVECLQLMSPRNHLADFPDNTRAQVFNPKPETFDSEWVPTVETKECQEQEEQPDNASIGKDLEIGLHKNTDLKNDYQSEMVSTNITGTRRANLAELCPKKDSKQLNEEQLKLNSENPIEELGDQVADLIGLITNYTNPQVKSLVSEVPNGLSNISDIKDKVICDTGELPSLELSLKRLRGAEDVGTCAHDDRNVLRRSDLSSFSRYDTASTANQAPTGNVGSCSPVHNSSEAVKTTDSMDNLPSNSDGTPPYQCSNGSSNNNNMGSITNNIFTKTSACNEKSVSTSAVKHLHPHFVFQSEKADDVAVNALLVRYQNRKRLAAQCPRIRGQFVRHVVYEKTT